MSLSSKHAAVTFRGITLALALAASGMFAWGVTHQSEAPVIFGRYSLGYALLLCGIAAATGVLWAALFRPRAGLSRFLANAYLVFGTMLVTFLAIEIGLRLINPWGMEFFHTLPYHMQGMVDHPVLGYVHPKSVAYSLGKNRVALNSHGLRDEEYPIAKPLEEKRILVLGDSVTFGWGISQGETFSDRMEPILQRRTGRNWQVINAGVNGYNTEQEADWLRIYGLAFKPDIVVLVYVENDTDPILDPNATTWRRYPGWPSSLPELMERIRSLSYLFQMTKLMQRAQELEQQREQKTGQPMAGVEQSGITRHARWPESRAALADIAARCKAAGIPFLVARYSGHDPAFLRELAGLGIPTIELTSARLNVPKEAQYVSRVDPHPAPAVHAEMALVLVDELSRRGWLRFH